MCEKCGDDSCPGFTGTAVDKLEYTKESSKQACEVFDKIRKMCLDIKDNTGVKQIENLVKFALTEGMRADRFLLEMVDCFSKYMVYKQEITRIREEILKATVLEDVTWGDTPPNDPNKKLN